MVRLHPSGFLKLGLSFWRRPVFPLEKGCEEPRRWCVRKTARRAGSKLGFFRRWLIVASPLAAPLAVGALSISGFKNNLVGYLLDRISTPGQFEVRAEIAEDDPSGRSALVNLRILDAAGVWFRAERLAFTWSPTRLLSGEVQIDELALEGGHLIRLPTVQANTAANVPASVEESAVAWPRSPITAHVKAIVIRNMRIANAVLPGGIQFDANGALQDEGDLQSFALELQRTDTVAGDIAIQYRKRFDSGALKLDVNAREAAQGLVSKLLDLPDAVPVALQLNGDGTPSQWLGNLKLNAERWLALDGTLEAQWQSRVAAQLGLRLTTGAKLEPALRQSIGQQADLSLIIAEGDDRKVRIERAQLRGGALKSGC